MKNRSLHFNLFLMMFLFIGTISSIAQTVDTTNVFDPAITTRQLVYAEVTYHELDENAMNGAFVLSPVEIAAFGDYSAAVAFYEDGVAVRNQNISGFSRDSVIIPIDGQIMKLWFALDMESKTYKSWAQTGDMEAPLPIYNEYLPFRNTNVDTDGINRWSTFHYANEDSLSVQKVELQTSTDATLKSLSFNVGELDTEFDSNNLEYELTVPFGITTVDLDVVTNGMGADVDFFDGVGNDLPSDGVITFGGDGIDVQIIVTALDGTEITYYVSIFYDSETASADLSSIDLSAGNLISDFDPLVLEYTAIVPNGSTSINVTGVPAWEKADVAGGGSIDVSSGSATTTITVTSEDGSTTNIYTINLVVSEVAVGNSYYFVHEASDLVIGETGASNSAITLYEPIINENTQLFQLVESGVEGQYYIKNQDDHYFNISPSNTWSMRVVDALTQDLDSCRFIVKEFEAGRFTIQSVSKSAASGSYLGTDGSSVGSGIYINKTGEDRDLSIWNIKNPADVVDPNDTYLSDISSNYGSLIPTFDLTTTEYYLILPIGTESIEVTAVLHDETSSVEGTGTIDVSAGEGSFVLTVTAADPNYTREYTVNYKVDTPLALKHSYTFADGTAKDVVGNAHGKIIGGSVSEGIYTADESGEYIEFDAAEIAINQYTSATIELYVTDELNTQNLIADGSANTNTMLSYLGGAEGTYGVNYLFTSLNCKASISTNNLSSPWSTESAVATDGINLSDDGASHHILTTINSDSICLYVDGYIVGVTQLSDNNGLPYLSNDYAYLMKSGYANDSTFLGSVLEYNIYQGIMDEQEIALRSYNFPIDSESTDATLSDLTIDGETIEGFNPGILEYTIEVESLPTTLTPTQKIAGATVEITSEATTIPGTTTILVTAVDGNTNTYTINYDVVTAVNEVKDLGIKVYPTVSNGSFTVASEGASTVVTVYSLTGKLIKQINTNSSIETFDVDQKGMYIVKVNSDGVTKIFKVIKK